MLNVVRRVNQRFKKREAGQALAEYALLVALIAVAAIGAITLLGNEITDVFNTIGAELANVS